MNKRVLSILLAGLLTVGAMAGCSGSTGAGETQTPAGSASAAEGAGGGESKSSGGKVEIEFYSMKNEAKDVYDQIIAKFQEENPNITVSQVSPADSETVFMTRVSTNDIPDVTSIYPAEKVYQNLMDEGIMADLTGEEFLQRAEPKALEMSTYQGKIYAMPFALSSYGIFYNKDIFEQNGIARPESYEELIAACEKLKATGMDPLVFADKDVGAVGQEAERIIGIIKNDGYKDFELVGKGETDFTQLDYVKVMAQSMLQLRGYAPANTMAIGREQATSDFINGKHAMYVSGTWGLAAIIKAAPDMNIEMMPLFNPYPGGETNLPVNIDIAVGYTTATKHPEESKKFVEYLTRPEINQLLADQEGTPTVIKDVNYNIPQLAYMKELMETKTTFLTLVNFWPAGFRNEWAIYIQQLLGDKDVDKFIQETDRLTVQYYTQQAQQ